MARASKPGRKQAPAEPPDALDTAIRGFLGRLAVERRASRHTVAAYGRDLGQLAGFLRERLRRAVRPADVSKLTLRAWLGELGRSLSSGSIARKLAAVRGLLGDLERRGELPSNAAKQLATPKLRRKMPMFLGVDAAKEVVEAPTAPDPASEEPSPERVRDAALLELLYGSGLRLSELAALDIEHLALSDGSARVLGKGKKERVVPLGQKAISAVLAYLGRRGELVHPRTRSQDARALLLGRRGERLGARRIQQLVRRWGVLGAGRADLHPHALRHTCATHMLEGGADLRAIQELLGHTSLSMTQRYTHLSLDQLLRVYDAAHPLARAKAR